MRGEGRLVAQKHAGVAVVAAAIEAYVDELRIEVARLLETAHGGRPQAQHQAGRPVELKLRGTTYQVSTVNTGPSRYRVTVASGGSRADRRRRDGPDRRVPPAARRRRAPLPRRHRHLRPEHAWSRSTGWPTGSAGTRAGCSARRRPHWSSPRPSRVGEEVEAGAPVLVLESMKMETVLYAPFAARVKELLGDHRQPGRDRRRAGQAGADRGRRRGGGRRGRRPAPRSTCPHRRSGSRPRSARPGPAQPWRPSSSGTTCRRRTRATRWPTTSPPARSSGPRACRWSPRRWRCSAPSPTSPS